MTPLPEACHRPYQVAEVDQRCGSQVGKRCRRWCLVIGPVRCGPDRSRSAPWPCRRWCRDGSRREAHRGRSGTTRTNRSHSRRCCWRCQGDGRPGRPRRPRPRWTRPGQSRRTARRRSGPPGRWPGRRRSRRSGNASKKSRRAGDQGGRGSDATGADLQNTHAGILGGITFPHGGGANPDPASAFPPTHPWHDLEVQGFHKGSVSLIGAVSIGLAATASAYSLTGALGHGAAEAGYQLPVVSSPWCRCTSSHWPTNI